jgi:mRNA interferase RelE/StbE
MQSGPLIGFTKNKPKAMSLRIVYRPVESQKLGGEIRMEVIAIGPKDREEVYDMAAVRVAQFKVEMSNRLAERLK